MRIDNIINCDICKNVITTSTDATTTVVHDPYSTDIIFNDTCPTCSTLILNYINSIKK
jgi:hypothetical protein